MKKILTDDDKFIKYVVRGLLRLWSRYPPRKEALLAARRPYQGVNKRQKWEYKCASCLNYFKGGRGGDIEVDHIIPKGSYIGDLWLWADRLFCRVENLQVLCKSCHYQKSAKEGEIRRQRRAEIKKNITPAKKLPRMKRRTNG